MLSHASKSKNPSEVLSEKGIHLPDNFTPLHLAKTVHEWTDQHTQSKEYAAIAKESTIRALSEWYFKHETKQVNLFTSESDPTEIWRDASASLNSIEERDRFESYLESHIDEISNLAFETAKITQSFAAGWFNKHVKEEPPTDKEIQGFLSFSFKKMRDELLSDESGKRTYHFV